MLKNSVYIITKPLQYINATNIEDNKPKICLLVNSFRGAETVFRKIKTSVNPWKEIFLFNSEIEAIKWVLKHKKEINSIYTYSDYGLRNYIFLLMLGKTKKYVYEEGLGNYFLGIRKSSLKNRFIAWIYRLFGNFEIIGGSSYIDGIFLYRKELFRREFSFVKNKVLPFKRPFVEHVAEVAKSDLFFDAADRKKIMQIPADSKILIYLGTWYFDAHGWSFFKEKKVDEILLQYKDFNKIYKPHPHEKASEFSPQTYFDIVLSGNTMIEMVFMDLLPNAQQIVIIHHNSSALEYFNNDKIRNINVGW